MTNLQQAADSLALHLFKASYSELGSVGQQAPATLVVYVNGPRTSWTAPTPLTWTPAKFRVEWRFDMGPTMLAARVGR